MWQTQSLTLLLNDAYIGLYHKLSVTRINILPDIRIAHTIFRLHEQEIK